MLEGVIKTQIKKAAKDIDKSTIEDEIDIAIAHHADDIVRDKKTIRIRFTLK